VSTIDGATYTVDAAGNRTSKTDQRAGVTSNYGYDALYELTQVTQGVNTTESYTYDPVGNRLSSLGVSPYNYNLSNELTSTPSTTYAYDYNGNVVTKTDSTGTTTYAWDFENRLTSVTLPGTAGTVTFRYDPFGRRIQKSSTSGTTIFSYDGDKVMEELSSGGTAVARYTQGLGIDEPLAMYRSGVASYYHADGLGSIAALTNASGNPVAGYLYDSFGRLAASAGSMASPFRYTAREFDPETSLYYYRDRYYDSSVGRFLAEDPLRFDGGNHFYLYVLNNPVNFIDPWGLMLCRIRLPGIGDTFLDDSFVPLVKKWTTLNGGSGIDVSFTEAFRCTAYQAGLASNPNAITPAPPGSSLHEAGFAVDIAWSRIPQDLQPTVVANAQLAGLNWGGYFRKPDRVHFYNSPGGRKQLIKKAQEQYKRGVTCKCSL
jgi:RHS repeat-associated protein